MDEAMECNRDAEPLLGKRSSNSREQKIVLIIVLIAKFFDNVTLGLPGPFLPHEVRVRFIDILAKCNIYM
jgi:hypothetical protein